MKYVQETATGGCPGFVLEYEELARFSHGRGSLFSDTFIFPVRNVGECDEETHNSMSGAMYWETPEGKHGWACGVCGLVLQWG